MIIILILVMLKNQFLASTTKKVSIHYKNLKHNLRQGLKTKKVRRVLEIDQSVWLKSNTSNLIHKKEQKQRKWRQRKAYYKPMRNALHGKTWKTSEAKLTQNW